MRRINQYSIQISFEREVDGWYAIVPEWEGSHADLQMVSNADVMCSIMSQEENLLHTILSTIESLEYDAKLIKVQDTPEIGGAVYLCNWVDKYKLDPFEIWLCDVTRYVLGEMSPEIYVKVLS